MFCLFPADLQSLLCTVCDLDLWSSNVSCYVFPRGYPFQHCVGCSVFDDGGDGLMVYFCAVELRSRLSWLVWLAVCLFVHVLFAESAQICSKSVKLARCGSFFCPCYFISVAATCNSKSPFAIPPPSSHKSLRMLKFVLWLYDAHTFRLLYISTSTYL